MLRWSVHDEQVCQAVQHVVGFEPAWTHRRIVDKGPPPPLGDGLRIRAFSE